MLKLAAYQLIHPSTNGKIPPDLDYAFAEITVDMGIGPMPSTWQCLFRATKNELETGQTRWEEVGQGIVKYKFLLENNEIKVFWLNYDNEVQAPIKSVRLFSDISKPNK